MNRNIYLAARYSRRVEMVEYAIQLEDRGYRVVSSWVDGHHEMRPGIDANATEAEKAAWAKEDVHDCSMAHTIVSFTDGGGGRGGWHVEFGIGLALRARLVVIGPSEHIFHALPHVEHYDSWLTFLVVHRVVRLAAK